jgi:predicted RNA-binding Zn ribbon-like protein
MAPAPGEDRSIALALVNTELAPRGEALELLGDVASLTGWLRNRGLRVSGLGSAELEAVRTLRSAIRTVFTARAGSGSPPPRDAVAEINRAAGLAPSWPRLRWGEEGPRRERAWVRGATAGEIALATIAADAIETLHGATGERLRRCEAHGCTRLFIQDHGRRRWCSRTCGDRVRFARHYRRTHPSIS